jgi:hypothetical protein
MWVKNPSQLARLRDVPANPGCVGSNGQVAAATLRVPFGLALETELWKQKIEAVRKYPLLLVAATAGLALASGVTLAA